MSDVHNLVRLETIHEPTYKSPHTVTYYGEYEGVPVVVKQAAGNLAREASILNDINYSGIPNVVDYLVQDNTTHLLILERLPGTALSTRIKLTDDWHSVPMQEIESVAIVDRLAVCFTALKNAGYIYRDLNFGHILTNQHDTSLVDHEWDVKLDANGVGIVDSLAGTWETMAPEEYEVNNVINEATTVFTLGTVLLQLLTGVSPFYIDPQEIPDENKRRNATLQRMQSFTGVTILRSDMNKILNKALHPDASQRYQEIEEFRNQLELAT